MSYDELICAQFPVVARQVEVGLYVVKRTAAYLKKVCDRQTSFAQDIEKVTKHEEGKMGTIQTDQMFRHVAASVEVQEIALRMAQQHGHMGLKCMEEVVKPLEAYFKLSEEKRKKIVSQENKLSKAIQSMRKNVRSERSSCRKLFDECLKLKGNVEKESEPQRIEKAQNKLGRAKEKAHKQFEKFERLREESLAQLDKYYCEDMPGLLRELTGLERDRLANLKQYLDHFSKLQIAASAELPISATFAEMVEKLDAQGEIETAVRTFKMNVGDEKEREPLECDIPCSSAKILLDDWYEGDSSMPASFNSSTSLASGTGSSHGAVSSAPFQHQEQQQQQQQQPYQGGSLFVKALYDYPQGEDGDLTFEAGMIIEVLSTGDGPQLNPNTQGWWEGRIHSTNRTGRFPSNYTEITETPPPATEASAAAIFVAPPPGPPPQAQAQAPAEFKESSGAVMARALYDYVYEPCGDPAIDNMGYISFSEGDAIQVMSQEDEWWFGEVNGQSGYFPANCVQLL